MLLKVLARIQLTGQDGKNDEKETEREKRERFDGFLQTSRTMDFSWLRRRLDGRILAVAEPLVSVLYGSLPRSC